MTGSREVPAWLKPLPRNSLGAWWGIETGDIGYQHHDVQAQHVRDRMSAASCDVLCLASLYSCVVNLGKASAELQVIDACASCVLSIKIRASLP